MRRIILAILLAITGVYAHAGNWGVQYHFLSNHFEDRAYEDWNEGTHNLYRAAGAKP